MKVAIIGGGYTGLTAAYELGKAGHSVELFEAAPEVGGQARTFPVGGTRLEVFYHHLFLSDQEILGLAEELGLVDRFAWIPSRAGFFYRGHIYPFSTPIDLLRFRPLHPFNRLRVGLVSLFLMRYRNWRAFEGITADRWIARWAGRQAYDVMWRALLQGKFGDVYDRVSMTWFWGKIHLRGGSRKGLGPERLGYPEGSFQILTDVLVQAVEARGGRIHTSAPVQRILLEAGRARSLLLEHDRPTGPYDAVVATVPSPAFLALAPDLPQDYAQLVEGVRYQAALCLVLQLKQSLSPIYWLNISALDMPFVGAIEHTNYIPPEVYGGRHLLYLSNYLEPDHPLFSLSEEELLRRYVPGLKRINPTFDLGWVERMWRFEDRGAQPVITTHYSRRIPSYRTPIPGLYLANTTQIYPEDRGTNYSVRLGQETARLVGEGPREDGLPPA
jgi:protoporphyrinogen oxidase